MKTINNHHGVETWVDVGPCRLHFSVIQGSETTIALEVGGGADSSYWGSFPRFLAQGTGGTVVTYDRAGFGESDLPESPYNMKQEIHWFMQGLDRLGLVKNVILSGHSYGGWLIRLIASEFPAVVRGLVFIDPFTTEFVDLLGVDYLDHHPMAAKDPPFAFLPPEEITKNQRAQLRVVRDGLAPLVVTMRQSIIPEGIPVRIITSGEPWWLTSRENQAWREAHQRMAASIPGAKLVVAEGCDHFIPEKQPEIVLTAVQEVIQLTGENE